MRHKNIHSSQGKANRTAAENAPGDRDWIDQETAVNLIAVCCVLGWRIFWMTMVRRATPQDSPLLALTEVEVFILDQVATTQRGNNPNNTTLADYLLRIARLGGYLARAHDPPPGNVVMWRGLSRLTDIQLGFAIGAQLCG